MIQVYAPTSDHSEETIDNFHEQLHQVKESIPAGELFVITGDFNTKVGNGADEDYGIGQHGLCTQNESGEKLAYFCKTNNMMLANIF